MIVCLLYPPRLGHIVEKRIGQIPWIQDGISQLSTVRLLATTKTISSSFYTRNILPRSYHGSTLCVQVLRVYER